MYKAAVAVISFFDNEIKQTIVECEEKSWKSAYGVAINELFEGVDNDQMEWVMSLPDEMADARVEMFSGEMDFCVTWVE